MQIHRRVFTPSDASRSVKSMSTRGCRRFGRSVAARVARSPDANEESSRLSLSLAIFRLIAFPLAMAGCRERNVRSSGVELSNYLEANLCLLAVEGRGVDQDRRQQWR